MVEQAASLVRRPDAPEIAGFDPQRLALLAERVQSLTQEKRPQAVTYLVARNGIVVAEEAFGSISHEAGAAPVTTDAVFALASLTKPITATAVMLLVEEGSLSLSRPVTDYLPELAAARAAPICLHHLLTHTSGLDPVDANDRIAAATERDGWSLDVLLRACYPLEARWPPGTLHTYAGVNYLLLGEIVQRAAGTPLAELMERRLFRPLGMGSTSLGLTERLEARRVRPAPDVYRAFSGYDPNDLARLRVPHPAGGAFSTAADLATFGQLFLDGGRRGAQQILSRAAVVQMTQNQIAGIGTFARDGRWVPEACWGWGWRIQGDERAPYTNGALLPRGSVYHEGASGAGLWIEPQTRVLGVYLSTIRAIDPGTELFTWDFDIFQDMTLAALTG